MTTKAMQKFLSAVSYSVKEKLKGQRTTSMDGNSHYIYFDDPATRRNTFPLRKVIRISDHPPGPTRDRHLWMNKVYSAPGDIEKETEAILSLAIPVRFPQRKSVKEARRN